MTKMMMIMEVCKTWIKVEMETTRTTMMTAIQLEMFCRHPLLLLPLLLDADNGNRMHLMSKKTKL